jgi:AcrR family transcriptional regulator
VLVGGELRAAGVTPRASARERILTAAAQLFYERGIQATGVDSIITTAGVAKATFYRHFPSKDDLVVAWLRDPRSRWVDVIRARIETTNTRGFEAIQLFFQAVAEWLEVEGFRGCPYLNTGVEITDPTHPAQAVIRENLQEIEDYLYSLVVAAGYRDARALAAGLQTLVAGAISLAVPRRSTASVVAAWHAAMSLLAGAARD